MPIRTFAAAYLPVCMARVRVPVLFCVKPPLFSGANSASSRHGALAENTGLQNMGHVDFLSGWGTIPGLAQIEPGGGQTDTLAEAPRFTESCFPRRRACRGLTLCLAAPLFMQVLCPRITAANNRSRLNGEAAGVGAPPTPVEWARAEGAVLPKAAACHSAMQAAVRSVEAGAVAVRVRK